MNDSSLRWGLKNFKSKTGGCEINIFPFQYFVVCLYLRCEFERRMMFSKNVFCGATKPRRPPGILNVFLFFALVFIPFAYSNKLENMV